MTQPIFLPYPVSGNRATRAIKAGESTRVIRSKAAKAYKQEVMALCLQQKVKKLEGKVSLTITVHPLRPKNYLALRRKHGDNWDLDIRCLDLDNVQKTVLDALKNIAFEDDKYVFEINIKRGLPASETPFVTVEVRKANTHYLHEQEEIAA